jgi:type VI secretion system protein ImpA
MPTAEPLVDFAALSRPLPDANPAAEENFFLANQNRYQYLRLGKDPDDLGKPDQAPYWPRLLQESKAALASKSKHLAIAANLAEALVAVHGFPGVRDGLKLIRTLIADECWPIIVPEAKRPADVAHRIRLLNALGTEGTATGANYPTKIRSVALFGPLSCQDGLDSHPGFEAAVKAATLEQCQALVDDVTAAADEFKQLDAALTKRYQDAVEADARERIPQEAARRQANGQPELPAAELEALCRTQAERNATPPAIAKIGTALADCLDMVRRVMNTKPQPTISASTATQPGAAAAPPAPVVTRETIFADIERLAGELERLEPGSALPMLMRKISALGTMPFPQLVEEMTKQQRLVDFIKPAAK